MELLSYGDDSDASNSENHPDDSHDVEVRTWLTDDESSESSGDEGKHTVSTGTKPHGLISADALFSQANGMPSYLKKDSVSSAELDTIGDNKKVVVPKKKAEVISAKPTLKTPDPSNLEFPERVGRETKAHIPERSTATKPKESLKRKGQSTTAKERVKNQRVSGQAGIGSDFREWRSEEEMRLRQQFD